MYSKILLFVIAVFFYVVDGDAAINSASITNGVVTISGSGFGANSLETEWTGANIEEGSVGGYFEKTKWTSDNQSTERQKAVYTNERAHSGTKSILSSLPIQTQYTSGFTYNNGSRFNEIYATYWVYFDHVDTAAQWKMWRIRPVDAYGDIAGEIMTSNWYTSTGGNYQNYVYLFCNTGNYAQCYPGGVSDLYGDASDLLPIDTWVRVEIHAIGSSADGVADGSLYFGWQIPGSAPHVLRQYENNITTRLPGTNQWQYFVFENYWGNVSAGTGTNEKFYFDDIFIQTGSQARVEVGNDSVLANCTHREIQPATAWSTTGITATLNQGSMPDGPAYLFVVDENGVASEGYAITLGSEPAYNPPTVSAGSDQTVYTSTATIIGTATADLGVTISGVTCAGQTVTPDDGVWDEQEESWTCSVVDLVLGPNVLEFIATDSEGQTGSDSVTVTRTQPGYSTRGSGYTIKGCSLK